MPSDLSVPPTSTNAEQPDSTDGCSVSPIALLAELLDVKPVKKSQGLCITIHKTSSVGPTIPMQETDELI